VDPPTRHHTKRETTRRKGNAERARLKCINQSGWISFGDQWDKFGIGFNNQSGWICGWEVGDLRHIIRFVYGDDVGFVRWLCSGHPQKWRRYRFRCGVTVGTTLRGGAGGSLVLTLVCNSTIFSSAWTWESVRGAIGDLGLGFWSAWTMSCRVARIIQPRQRWRASKSGFLFGVHLWKDSEPSGRLCERLEFVCEIAADITQQEAGVRATNTVELANVCIRWRGH
jgi:hypothetical protein